MHKGEHEGAALIRHQCQLLHSPARHRFFVQHFQSAPPAVPVPSPRESWKSSFDFRPNVSSDPKLFAFSVQSDQTCEESVQKCINLLSVNFDNLYFAFLGCQQALTGTRYPTLPGFCFYYPYPTRNFFQNFRVQGSNYTCRAGLYQWCQVFYITWSSARRVRFSWVIFSRLRLAAQMEPETTYNGKFGKKTQKHMRATKCLFRLTVKSSTMLLVYEVYTHGRPPFTLPATLPVTRIFFHYPTRTLPEVKKPYPSQPAPNRWM